MVLATSPVSAAPKLACTQDASRAYYCIDENGVRSGTGKHAGLRASRLYSGSPKAVKDAKAYLIVDCPTRIAVLQDLDGVNFAGGRGHETRLLRDLSRWVCEAKVAKPDPKLRQFGPE